MENKKNFGVLRGRFELLHPGHIKLIQTASKLVDHLVIAIDTEEYIKEKGQKESFTSTYDRYFCLNGIKGVDDVFSFSSEKEFEDLASKFSCSYSSNIGGLSINRFYFKGADYRIEDLPEAKELKNCGWNIVLLDYDPNYSTTKLIQKIRGNITIKDDDDGC